jgi:demethylmenaquinone methyltransferase/2-methoxy-6-polyprenyl-1,4-benzoquinol methylase
MSLVLSKNDSPKMFDQIAKRYDLVNRLLSFGQDVIWREEIKNHLPAKRNFELLDIATGTGDVVISLVKDNPDVRMAYGVDLSEGMLEIAKVKIKAENLQSKIMIQKADAQALPFLESTFDAVTISFGIRNIPDLRVALLEMYRVLNKDGVVLILEFSLPKNPVIRIGHWIYINVFVPMIGLIFSGHTAAYRYLAQTIETFPYGDRFCRILKQMGFVNIQSKTFMGGTATLYWAKK